MLAPNRGPGQDQKGWKGTKRLQCSFWTSACLLRVVIVALVSYSTRRYRVFYFADEIGLPLACYEVRVSSVWSTHPHVPLNWWHKHDVRVRVRLVSAQQHCETTMIIRPSLFWSEIAKSNISWWDSHPPGMIWCVCVRACVPPIFDRSFLRINSDDQNSIIAVSLLKSARPSGVTVRSVRARFILTWKDLNRLGFN